MENSIVNKISSIIIGVKNKENDELTLLEYVELMNFINKQILESSKKFIKKANSKLSNNIAFFDYEIKSVEIADNILININHELKAKKVLISKEKLEITADFKNKELFLKLIYNDLLQLLNEIKKYDYLNNIQIKQKEEDLHINITPKYIELFMYKSPHWITMGKAFSLKYYFDSSNYVYDIDSIGLEKSIKDQEKVLFSKISFKKNLLPREMQILNDNYKNIIKEKNDKNPLKNLLKKLINIVKK